MSHETVRLSDDFVLADGSIASPHGDLSAYHSSLKDVINVRSLHDDNVTFWTWAGVNKWWTQVKGVIDRKGAPAPFAFLLLPFDRLDKLQLTANGLRGLDEISGGLCHFLIFYDGVPFGQDNRRLLEDNRYRFFYLTDGQARLIAKDNAAVTRKIAGLLEIPEKQLPCLVFFEDLHQRDIVVIHLAGREPEEITDEVRVVCQALRTQAAEYYQIASEIRELQSRLYDATSGMSAIQRDDLTHALKEAQDRLASVRRPLVVVREYATYKKALGAAQTVFELLERLVKLLIPIISLAGPKP